MRVLCTFWSFVRRHRTAVCAGVLVCVTYFSSWNFRRELGLVKPMANLRYFYFGGDPESVSDRALYWFYYPVYRPYLACQVIRYGERSDVHWSDRRDAAIPTPAELGMTDADFR